MAGDSTFCYKRGIRCMENNTNMRERRADTQFLVRVLRNEITTEEKEFFDKWLADSDENKEEFSTISLLWDKFVDVPKEFLPNAELQWERIERGIETVKSEKSGSQEKYEITGKTVPAINTKKPHTGYFGHHHSRISVVIRVAAMFLIAVGLYYISLQGNFQVEKPTINPKENITNTIYELVSQKGEKKTFLLADGSTVYLNSESKLKYPKNFSGGYRDVEISGEAYFSVKSDKEMPFRVRSGNTTILVTGTEFNVKNRGSNISVVVTKGTIIAYSNKTTRSYNLSGGQMISYDERQGFSSPKSVEVEKYLGWRNNKFFFERTSLNEVMAEIERFYNVKVVFASDSLKKKTITGTFNGNSLENIFSIICLTLDVKIDYNGKSVLVF